MSSLKSFSFIVELDSPDALDGSIVGGKVASISELMRQGVQVPYGFAIHVGAYAIFIEPAKTRIAELLADVDPEVPLSAEEASDSIIKLIGSMPTPPELVAEVTKRVAMAPSANLAVRSSATTEDLEDKSFAGLYETFMDPTNAESVLQRIRDVWDSYYSGRAISYRAYQGISHESGLMGILVMEFINADAGGVVFTRDPRDGADQILINVALGLGESVVAGHALSDSFVLTPDGSEISNRNVIDKEWMFTSPSAGELELVPVPSETRSAPSLSDANLLAVAKAATAIKKSSGDDRDIEFAVKDNVVHILQSRPITTGAKKTTEFPVEWDNPEEEKLHWIVGGHEPILPLVIDMALMSAVAGKRSMDAVGEDMGKNDLKKVVNGYLYNAASPRDPEVTKSTLFKHHLKGRRYLEKGTTYYYEEVEPVLLRNLGNLEATRPANDATIPELMANLRRAMGVGADHMNDLHWRAWAGFKASDNKMGSLFSKITGRPEIEVADLVLGLDHMTSRVSKRLIGLAVLVKSDPWLNEVFSTRDYQALFTRGNGFRPALRKFRTRFRSLLKTWGCRNGIGYGSAWKPPDPTWNMQPEIPLDSIGSFARQDPEKQQRDHRKLVEKRKSAIRAVRKKIGRNSNLLKKFEFELFKVTHHTKMMEGHNYLIEQRTYGEYRESINRVGMALVRGEWIDVADDVFYLRLAEMDDAVSSDDYSGLRSSVAQAKAEREENSKLERPDFIGTKPPEKEKDNDKDEPLRGLSEDGLTLHGEASSPGAFTGTARVVITRTSRPPDVKKGSILVTENTGPDWVPVFPLIGALVLDGGDNFQHASLISREYGIPCVIQTKEATSKIADGQMITVDGSAGTVMLNPLV